jgi:hypothetical protein
VIPISIDHAFDENDWPVLRDHDIVWIDEAGENWAAGEPSLEVLDGIEFAYKIRSRPRSAFGNALDQRLVNGSGESAIMVNERGGRSIRKLAAKSDVSEMSFGAWIRANATPIHSACYRSSQGGNSTRSGLADRYARYPSRLFASLWK